MADYAKRQLKALDRIAKKIADAEGHLTKIEDSIDNKKHRTAQHETIKDIKSILNKEFKELDEKLAALPDDEGGKIKAFRAEHHYLEKAKEILQKAGKYNPDDKD